MISKFFIEHPIFASVISIVIVMQRLSGLGKKTQDTAQAPKKGVIKQAPAK